MNNIDNIRNSIIDKLLSISNEDYLSALNQLIDRSGLESDKIQLTKTQLEMLNMSEDDIKNGRLISQEDLDGEDLNQKLTDCTKTLTGKNTNHNETRVTSMGNFSIYYKIADNIIFILAFGITDKIQINLRNYYRHNFFTICDNNPHA